MLKAIDLNLLCKNEIDDIQQVSLARGTAVLGIISSCPCAGCPNFSLMCQFINNDGETNERSMFYTKRACPLYIKLWTEIVVAADNFYALAKDNDNHLHIFSLNEYERN